MEERSFRHELKYSINMADYLVIRQRFRAFTAPDSHAGKEGKYSVRSLYFETPDDKALREKLYGIANREKFRIRIYNNDDSFIRLEKKTKIGSAGSKLSAALTREQCEAVIRGDTGWMKSSGQALLLELYAKMQGEQLSPKTIVEYTREPFTYTPGNVRVTLDSNIRTAVRSVDLFDPDLPLIRTHATPVIILELKYDSFLPTLISDAVQVRNRRCAAFSKYAAGRMFG
jgi:hypothetical protein